MSWYVAPSLRQLLAEVNPRWPGRSRRSDGTIGDRAHSARRSDHNPNGRGSVNAIDITASGINVGALIAAAKKHPSVRYIIHNRRIMNRDIGNFRPRYYSGANPHVAHVHISIYQSRTAENRRRSWGIATAKASGGGAKWRTVKHGQVLKLWTKGAPVKEWQTTALGYRGKKADGYFGRSTRADTKRFQREHGLKASGAVGPLTWSRGVKKTKPKATSKPKTSTSKAGVKAPPFPLPSGHYFGPKSGPNRSVSGYYSHRSDLKKWQDQMRKRGWRITVDGLYGPATREVAKQFQRQKGLRVTGLIGSLTWSKAWTEKIT